MGNSTISMAMFNSYFDITRGPEGITSIFLIAWFSKVKIRISHDLDAWRVAWAAGRNGDRNNHQPHIPRIPYIPHIYVYIYNIIIYYFTLYYIVLYYIMLYYF